MSKFVGRQQEVGIGKESPRGTGLAPTFWLPKTAMTFDDKINSALVQGSYGSIVGAAMTAYVVEKWAEGNIEGEINANSFGLILLALFGTDTPSGPTDSAYTHVYTLDNDVDHPSLSIQIHDPISVSDNLDLRFRRAMINSLEISVKMGEVVGYVANFMSKVHQDATLASPTYSIDFRFVHPNLIFKVANTIDDIAAATAVSLKELTITFEKDVERLGLLGTLEPEDILNKTIKVSGKIELLYEDRTWRNYMLNGTTKAMEIKLVSSKLIGSSSYPTLDMIFPKVRFYDWEPKQGLGDIASQTLNFEIYYDLSNTRLWSSLQLINTTASY